MRGTDRHDLCGAANFPTPLDCFPDARNAELPVQSRLRTNEQCEEEEKRAVALKGYQAEMDWKCTTVAKAKAKPNATAQAKAQP